MRFVVCPFGSYGDVNPFVGLSMALQSRGHEPIVLACGYFRELIERQGLEFHELGTADEYLKAVEHPDLWHPVRGFPHIFLHGVKPILERQCDWIRNESQKGPIAVIASCLGFGAHIACEALGIPLITVHLQPSVIMSQVEPPKMHSLAISPWIPRWLESWFYWMGEKNCHRTRSVALDQLAS